MVPDMEYWLGRKYALLQQQADATTQNAATGALTGAAAARLDTTKAQLLPAESRASIARMGAETGLLGEQAKYLGPEANARIKNLEAQAYATRIGGDVEKRMGLTEVTTSPTSYDSIRKQRLPSMTNMGWLYGN